MTWQGDSAIAEETLSPLATAHGPWRAKTRFRVRLTLIGNKMKVAYFLKDTPVELSAIPALLTQDTI
jgi:hypothetical protein